MNNIEDIVRVINNATPSNPNSKKDEIRDRMHLDLPKIKFFKNLKENAKVLDVGAGDGSMVIFKSYLEPKRPDIFLYALSLEKGSFFDEFEAFELGDFNKKNDFFGGIKFDAIISSHFIEHIEDSRKFVTFCSDKLDLDGKLYLEYPHPNSKITPTKKDLMSRGISLSIGNFFDDSTHKNILNSEELKKSFLNKNFKILEDDLIKTKYEKDIFYHFKKDEKSYEMQLAYYSLTGWAQYFVLKK